MKLFEGLEFELDELRLEIETGRNSWKGARKGRKAPRVKCFEVMESDQWEPANQTILENESISILLNSTAGSGDTPTGSEQAPSRITASSSRP